jgi:hypothetical protein
VVIGFEVSNAFFTNKLLDLMPYMTDMLSVMLLGHQTKGCGALNKLAWDFAVDGSPKSKT